MQFNCKGESGRQISQWETSVTNPNYEVTFFSIFKRFFSCCHFLFRDKKLEFTLLITL